MSEKTPENFIPHLVVGSDLFSLATYNTLVEKYGRDNVAILSPSKITKSEAQLTGPSGLRGKANTQVFRDMFPELDPKISGENSFFYKESKLHSFNSRTKPDGEKIFSKVLELKQTLKRFSHSSKMQTFLMT
jgi:hypothetical protein